MVERSFLDAVRAFLAANLSPAPATLGIAEPVVAGDLPAVVLSLDRLERPPGGLGERSTLMTDGALRWTITIDLASPVLAEDPAFSLISLDRLSLVLHHGGLVRADASAGLLGPADLSVTVAGQPRDVVNAAPSPGQVRCDPLVGRLTFGSALPGTGDVVASYFIGQWEQRIERLKGALTVRVAAAAAAEVETTSDAVIELFTRKRVPGMARLTLTELQSIARPDVTMNARWRAMAFEFEYEAVINRPDSSGGLIQQIPLTTVLLNGA